ncbi:MAG: site-2 protease family protein [Woronichinia naegeliana WA131]|jgi:membrane-associated protease RseP (regulator of RpoE activity)|uniref:Site-2 protease family protein n=1 Tax=Woronichinia naegeliana WA131 TaxID=2824559 RepID=A0A977KU53_9CYAN|nr:MAG: site-2 protease family protein [Woronichinia naegeliana WA131]
MWLFLFLLGFITYFVVKSSAANVTRTPVWLLWFVLMIPALIWTLWSVVYGEDQPLPLLLILGPFLVCPGLYWWLVQKGRITPEKKEETSLNPGSEEDKTTTDTKIRPINVQEEKSLRDCFPWGVYYLQQLDYRPQAILCRGKLQTAPEMAYERIKDNVENVFGDRFLVLFQESLQGQPFFALIPNPVTESQPETTSEPLSRPWIALALLVMTIFTTTLIGAEMSGVTSKELQADPMVLSQGLPYALGIISILGIHELSHYLTAIYYKVRTTLPYFIPIPFFLGTFGAFIQMKSPVPHRRALFDVAIAGPLGGLVIALPLLYWGLSQSSVVPISSQGTLIQFQALDPRFSVLLSLISKLALGATLKPGMALDLHPLAIAGYIGIIVTALNLMPFGQLDGGHIIHAMLGQRVAIIVGQMTRIVVVILAFIRRDFFLWAIILLLMPVSDQPALNDVTELDNRRDFLGIFAMVILVSILLPLPKVVAAWLGI